MKLTPLELEDLQRRLARNRDPVAAKAKEQQEKAVKVQKHEAGKERELSRLFCADLTRRGIPFICAPTNKKSALPVGWPDVTAMGGFMWDGPKCARVCCVELKSEGGRLSAEQTACHDRLLYAGIPVLVAYNLADAIEFVKRELRL